jgi:hypothetical protein
MLKVVLVKWNDAVLRSEENDTSKIVHKPCVLFSAGILLKSDKKGVTLATDFDPVGKTYREQSFIPRGMIVEEKAVQIK